MPELDSRTGLSRRAQIFVRRLLAFAAFFLAGAASQIDQSMLAFAAAGPMVLLILTDTCLSCGAVLVFWRGASFWTNMNPFYVPKVCTKCGNEI